MIKNSVFLEVFPGWFTYWLNQYWFHSGAHLHASPAMLLQPPFRLVHSPLLVNLPTCAGQYTQLHMIL